ncbi:MAG: amino acid permease [Calditrichaeota bacterium]|nr:amino acid permease [Calditrichota bacterium]
MSSIPSTFRILGFKDAYVLMVGNILGIGIFTTTGYIAQYVSDPGYMILIWVIGGFISFCGGVTYAELSTRFPHAGGDFHYLTHAYHPILGFLFGWAALLVTYTGSIAVIAVGFSHYFLNFFGSEAREWHLAMPGIGTGITLHKIIAVLITLFFTYVNVRGVRSGALFQRFFTFLSLFVFGSYIIAGLTSPQGNWEHLTPAFQRFPDLGITSKLGVALIGVYFTYSGWTVLAYVAGEIQNYRRNIPRATWTGVATVTVIYILINIVYLYAMPLWSMENVIDIGHHVLLILRGAGLSIVFNIAILMAVLSTLNATVLSGARIYFAMSREKEFFPVFGKIHSIYNTPAAALWLQFGWTVILILTGSFNQLLTYTVFVMLGFGVLSGFALFLLRIKQETPVSHYLAWGYPYTTIFYMVIVLWIMFNTFLDQPLETMAGVVLVATGILFYWYFRKKFQKKYL